MNNKNSSYIFLRSVKLILILPLLTLSLSGCFFEEEEIKRESITKGLSPKALFDEAKEKLKKQPLEMMERIDAIKNNKKYKKLQELN